MTLLVDISCPNCGGTRAVEKRGIDRYRCANCGREFGHADVLP